MKRIKKINRRVAALVMSFFLTLGLIAPAFSISAKAEAVEVLNGTATVADMIFAYCASGGVAIMNETVINEVYQELGSSYGTIQSFVDNGLLTTANGQYIDTGLSTSIDSVIQNISSLDIGSLFSQSASENPAGVALTAGGSLAGIAGGVATTGVLPLVAGIAIEGFAGFQLGTLIAHAVGLYGKPVYSGIEINAVKQQILDDLPGGYCIIGYKDNSGAYGYGLMGSAIALVYLSGGKKNAIFVAKHGNYSGVVQCYRYWFSSNYSSTFNRQYENGFSSNTIYNLSFNTEFDNSIEFGTESSANAYLNALKSGSQVYPTVCSPDVIGPNGNQVADYSEEGGYSLPDAIPQIDPSTQSVNPAGLTLEDWLSYANDAKGNYTNGDPDLNSDVLQDILDAIRINTPTPTPSPDPEPDPNPDPIPNPDPETVPVPSINPYPDSYPVADPETVPDNKPQPEYTEKQTENQTDIIEGDPYTTPDLLNKFPFCIPRDILKVFKKLDSGARQAPHIQWRFNPNSMIDYTFDIDFTTWDNVAALLRLLELAAFIIALGIATRNLILS